MEDNNYVINQVLSSPGIAIHGSGSALVKYSNTFAMKANGRVSANVTTADAPSLALATLIAPFPNGTAAIAGSLAPTYSRIYTLVATLPLTSSTAAPTFSWLAGTDFLTTTDLPNLAYAANPNQSNQVVVGYVVVANGTASAFVPGTTALDTASLTVTYINGLGFNGL
jgi:hypothetical protein